MRIAFVHSFYRSSTPSGENAIVRQQVETLRTAGHEVQLFARDSDVELRGRLYRIRAATRVSTGFGAHPLASIEDFAPDVIHIHNLFPNFGTRWLREVSAPVVATMHNFRAVCANGLLFRDGYACFDCPTGAPWSALTHRCYHSSATETLPLAIGNARQLQSRDVFRFSKKVVFLNQRAADLFVSWGLDASQVAVIPNGVQATTRQSAEVLSRCWVAVGRLTEEKGILELAKQWPDDVSLDIAGDGPEASAIAQLNRKNVRLLGRVEPHTLSELLPTYSGMVVPSQCMEMQPTVAMEAFAASVPVLAFKANVASDIVEHLGGGLTYSGAESLAVGIDTIERDREVYGREAARVYAQEFSTAVWLDRMLALYASVAETS